MKSVLRGGRALGDGGGGERGRERKAAFHELDVEARLN